MLYIVTIKLPKNPSHDPHDKQIGSCPADHYAQGLTCTDVTGEHHSFLVEAIDAHTARSVAVRHGSTHVTRVEALGLPLS